MKKRNMFITLGLALTLGVGVAAGLGARREAKVAKAENKDLYLCCNWSDWCDDNPPEIHYWGGATSTTWGSNPRGTSYGYSIVNSTTEGMVFKFSVPTDTAHIIIRKDSEDQQTKDFDFATNWGAQATNGFYLSGWDGEAGKGELSAVNLTFLEDGYYLVGDANFVSAVGKTGTAWSVNAGVKMDAGVGGDNASFIITVGSDAIECKARKLSGGSFDWLGSNHNSTGAGNYVFYVNGSDGTSLGKGIYINAFSASFLNDMQPVCGTTSSEWENDHSGASLNTVWAKHKARFESDLVDGEQAKFVTTSGVAGVARAATLYNHTANRYSLSAWTGAPSANVTLTRISNNSDNVSFIIIVISSLVLVSVGGFFLLRKKREN